MNEKFGVTVCLPCVMNLLNETGPSILADAKKGE
jgi:hypothetical protein